MWNEVGRVLSEAFGRLASVLVSDLPSLVAMVLVLAGTAALAVAVRVLLRRLLERLGLDRRAREWGLTSGRGLAPPRQISGQLAKAASWFVVLAGVALALDVLGATTPTALGSSLLSFLPRLLIGILVMLVGVGAARFLERSVLIGAVNQQLHEARFLALATKWLVLVLAAAMALQHVGVGGGLATLAFGIVLGGVMLAVALAVGLGAKDAVARALERRLPPGRPPDEDEPGEGPPIQHL